MAAIVLVFVGSYREAARDARRILDANQLQKAFQLRFLDKEDYPRSEPSALLFGQTAAAIPQIGLQKLVQEKHVGDLPVDPLNSRGICYRYRGEKQNFKLAVFMEYPPNKAQYATQGGGIRDD